MELPLVIKMDKRKNILDLKHNKYVQYYNTTIVLTFTYIIGLIIAITTQKITFNMTGIIIFISIIFLGTCTHILLNLKDNLQNTIKEIEDL